MSAGSELLHERVARGLMPVIGAIYDCIKARRTMPALMLLYAAMDVVASLESPTGRASRARFEQWTQRYLLAHAPLGCTATDLYGARCGVLHTLSAESDLSRKGQATQLFYTRDVVRPAKLQFLLSRTSAKDSLVLHVEDVVEAFRLGLRAYMAEVEADPMRTKVVTAALGKWLIDVPET